MSDPDCSMCGGLGHIDILATDVLGEGPSIPIWYKCTCGGRFDDSKSDYGTEEQAEERRLMEEKYGPRHNFRYGPDPLDDHLSDGSQ